MKAVIQRVKQASVTIEGQIYSQIGHGLLVLLGVEKNDTEKDVRWFVDKVSDLRIFEDDNAKMNLSVKDIDGEVLVVSQFTLAGNCKKGKRPSFDNAMEPSRAIELYEKFVILLKENQIEVKTGVFRAMMEVSLINDGPVTFILE